MVMVCWFFYFGAISGHFLENPSRKIAWHLHADVSWSPPGLVRLWLPFCWCFLFWRYFDLVKQVGFGVSGLFGRAQWFLPPLWSPFDSNWSYLRFLSIIWRTCGSECPERVGVNVQGGGGRKTLCVEFCLVSYAMDISKLIFNVAHATWLSLHGTVIWLLCGKDTIKQDDCFVPKCVTSNCRRLVGGRFISSIHQIRNGIENA